MEYESLLTLHYKDPEQVDTEYHARFNSPYCVHLDFDIHHFPAFYMYLPEMAQHMLQIYKTDRKIREIKHHLPGVAIEQFTRRCLIDEIVLTNNIEGVNSTRKDIDNILDDLEQADKRKRFHGLVKKYVMLQHDEDIPLTSCRDIRNIYDELVLHEVMEEDPADAPDGKIFRRNQVYVTSATQKIIHEGVYPEENIIRLMEKSLRYLQTDPSDLLIKISILHYLIGYIHPFYNGNGRLSRFISSYLLCQECDPLLSYRLSYTIKENIKDYYESFKVCNDARCKGDVTPFVLMFLSVIGTAADQLYKALKKRKSSLDYYLSLLSTMDFGGKEDQLCSLGFCLIQAALFSERGISTRELLEIENISRATLSKRLAFYNRLGLLTCSKYQNSKYYEMNLLHLQEAAGRTA